MSTVSREAPWSFKGVAEEREATEWRFQCLQDLDAGRHAEGCQCYDIRPMQAAASNKRKKVNACSEIVRCALEMRDYECEVGDADSGRGV